MKRARALYEPDIPLLVHCCSIRCVFVRDLDTVVAHALGLVLAR